MPLPAVRCRPEQTIVKMEMAPDLSLRGRFAPVAISRRHWRFAQATVKMVCTDCVCSGAQRAPWAVANMEAFPANVQCLQVCHCEAPKGPWQSREGTGDSHRPPLKWYAPIASVAALSERHGQLQIWRHSRRMCNASKFVIARPQRGRGNLGKAVSFSPMAFLRSGYDLRDCTPRALPRASRSGRHVGLWPPRNDKLGGLAPLNCCCTTCNCLRRSGSAAAAEPSKYPGMHPRKCGKAVAVGGFTKRSKKTSVWVLTKLRLGGIVSLALRGTEC